MPIIAIAALGYAWSSLKWAYDSQFVSRLVMDVGAPCLIFATMTQANIAISDVLSIATVTAVGLVFLCVLNTLLIKVAAVPLRTYLPPLTFANTGNMGAPICLFAFGEEALALALVVFMVTSMVHFSLGVSIVGNQHPLKTLMTTPVFYAAILSLLFMSFDIAIPRPLFNTIDMLGSVAIPLMLFSLGVSLHSLHASSVKRSLFYACMRLMVGMLTGFLLCRLFDLQGVSRGVILIQSMMPSAVFNYLLASSYQRDPEEVAGIVVFSTVISFMTLPIILWFIL